MEDFIAKVWAFAASTLAACIGWLVRRVFTNEKQIAILLDSQKRRDAEITEIKQDVKQLIRKVGE